MHRSQKVVGVLLLVSLCLFIALYPLRIVSVVPEYTVSSVVIQEDVVVATETAAASLDPDQELVSTSTLFVLGDIMLGRHVEHLMGLYGSTYPYEQMQSITSEPAYILANFEAAIPETHVKTPNFGFTFSVASTALPALRQAGVTHVSLANNHSNDYGAKGYASTVQALSDTGIIAMGLPKGVASTSYSVIDIGSAKVGVLAIRALTHVPGKQELQVVLEELKRQSDVQMVYVHWGYEYVRVPSAEQRALVRALSELGVSLIVGHHPHVVQSIETYEETLIFYSLGNFIFDQYFSADVQRGLVLKLEATDTSELSISLIPVSSESAQAQPRKMNPLSQQEFLLELADLSTSALRDEILAGKFVLRLPLATSTEIAIMDQ
jgi:poly-gamma-glutamate synthesis protein (capsule biosynthesis protein)